MSVHQLQLDTVSKLRELISKQQAKTIDLYAGEFDADEISQHSYSADAIFITTLGWLPSTNKAKPNGKDVRMAAFIATQHAKSRIARMQSAVVLTELVEAHLSCKSYCVADATRPQEFRAENLYDREVDDKKHALWLLSWTQTLDQPTGCIAKLTDWLLTHLKSVKGAETEITMEQD